MSRLRATIAPTDTDRQIQTALDRAAREIEAALRVASGAPLARSQKRATIGDLRQALEGVTRVRYLSAAPTEREPYEDWKARQDQKKQARAEARAAMAAAKEQADV